MVDNNLGLNLYVVLTTYCVIPISDKIRVWEYIEEKVNC